MKKIFSLLSGIMLLCILPAKAQMDSLFIDTVEINTSFEHMVDSCFEHLDLNEVPTGLLLEKAYATIDVKGFNGTCNDSNMATTWIWRKAYGTLRRAFIDSTAAYDTLGKIVHDMQVYVDSGYMPVALLNYNYNSFSPSALDDSLLYAVGMQLHDVPGRTQHPYQTNTCFVVAAAATQADSHVVQYVFSESFYISNDTRTVDYLMVDFGNGQAPVTVHWGDTVEVEYDSTMQARITVTLHFTNQSVLAGHFGLGIERNHIVFTNFDALPNIFRFQEAEVAYEGEKGKLWVSVRLGCGNKTGGIRKPFIVVGGFNPPQEVAKKKRTSKYHNGNATLLDIYRINFDLYTKLYQQGYDFIFVDYDDGSTYIQRNAYALESLIKWVNAQKAENGSTHQNVVMGISMGGLVARYALGHMYQQHLASPTTYPHHDTKLFYTYDSPHWGANAPVGIQAMVADRYRIFLSKFPSIPWAEYEGEDWDYLNITCPASKQMLINHVLPSANVIHDNFYVELENICTNNSIVGNVGCRMIGISNGSGKGVSGVWRGQYDLAHINPMYPGAPILSSNQSNVLSSYSCYAVPLTTQHSGLVYHSTHASQGVYFNGVNFVFINKRSSYLAAARHYNGVDYSPGGTGLVGSVIAHNILNSQAAKYNSPFSLFSFIPTTSALYVASNQKDDYFIAVDGGPGISLFNKFITNDHSSISPPLVFNDLHPKLTPENLELLNEVTVDEVPSELFSMEYYNFGLATTDRLANVIVNSGAILAVNEDLPRTGYYSSGFSDGGEAPLTNTHFIASTYKPQCMEPSPQIEVKDDGDLIIGDNTNRSGKLILESGSVLILKGDLTINNNSTLVIMPGAKLVVWPTAQIQLNGQYANIDLQGELELKDNTTFAYTGSGFIKLNSGGTGYSNITKGTNCSIVLEGGSTSQRLLEIIGGGIDARNLTRFSIKKGIVEMGTDAEIVTNCSTTVEQITFNRLPWIADNYVYKGLRLVDHSSSLPISLKRNTFNHAKKAIYKESSSAVAQLNVQGSFFNNCDKAIETNGYAASLSYVQFSNCNYGWYATNMSGVSEFKGRSIDANTKGIYYRGNTNAHLYMERSYFEDNTTAIDAAGDFTLTMHCNEFNDCGNSILAGEDVFVNLGDVSGSRIGGTHAGGSNNFYNTAGIDIETDASDELYIKNGYNNFIYPNYVAGNPFSPINTIYGTVKNAPSNQLDVQNNYWIFDASTTLLRYDLSKISTPSNVSVTATGGIQTTPNTPTCDLTTETDVLNNGGETYGKRANDNPADINRQQALKQIAYNIYPNPAANHLFIKVSNGSLSANQSVKAIDMMGRSIPLHALSHDSNTQSYDISQLAAGMYQIIVEQNGHILHKQKIVVSR